jgi:tetratricopeptide (TPR) repeat protein
MTTSIDFERLLLSSQGPPEALALMDPRSVASQKPPIAVAWRLLSGAIALRSAGRKSEANHWLDISMAVKTKDGREVLRAETVAEGALALFREKRFDDAGKILRDAAAQWMALCRLAMKAERPGPETTTLARELAAMLDALGAALPASRTTSAQAPSLVRAWLEDRAVPRWAEVLAAFARLLAMGGQAEDARKMTAETIDWIGQHFTSPGSKPLHKRDMTLPTRRALYTLLLARGEVELAAENFQASADGFGAAVKIYDGHVEDRSDISRMIQAHVNQANSLLRLGQYDKAIGIYELAQMGFRSIDDEASAARVEHAKLFARTKKAGGP